ncbi:TetR/AcrR family transcriptional regulator [Phaeacidiphilus oryzae]|uniref:TetR/AcrR family transcriptional regulator n=1 Tax=Phaeacidiphilus oryzae TaxID=348818 RepID=UPI0007C6F10D|nr:TetR/AcrR family transcriptional regulator [Phaeacidiphilus oryzae]
MTESRPAPGGRGPGRPPDAEIEPKVIGAALDVYGEVGWGGFTIDAVARRARVGKAAIYRRWPTKEALVAAAVRALRHEDEPMPAGLAGEGPLREQLAHIARNLCLRYLGPHGTAALRAMVEVKVYPAVLGEALDGVRRESIAAGRAVVLRAVERGELPTGTSPAMVMDALSGTVLHHVLLMPADRTAELAADPEEFIGRVVDFVLAGAGPLCRRTSSD